MMEELSTPLIDPELGEGNPGAGGVEAGGKKKGKKSVKMTPATLRKSASRRKSSIPTEHFSVTGAGLVAGGVTSPAEEIIKSIQKLSPVQEIEEGPTHGLEAAADGKDSQNKRVGLFALFRYSKTHERWLMVLGMIMAGVAGFSMPIWLLLLAQSLETFNQIGTIIASGGSIDILIEQMYSLIYSFAIVSMVVCLRFCFYLCTILSLL